MGATYTLPHLKVRGTDYRIRRHQFRNSVPGTFMQSMGAAMMLDVPAKGNTREARSKTAQVTANYGPGIPHVITIVYTIE